MQKIVPCLWFDHVAAEAVDHYTSVFHGGRVIDVQRYPTADLPDFQQDLAGKPLVINFEIAGYAMTAINAGPEFRVNPSISFMIRFDGAAGRTRQDLDAAWAVLADGGTVLMPLQVYDFSPYYGWVADRYGVSWQLMVPQPGAESRPPVMPSLMFGAAVFGRAAEAIEAYTSLLGGDTGTVARYPDAAGKIMYADFQLAGQWFSAMDGAGQEDTFNCGVSLTVQCDGQDEIDRLWAGLSAVPAAEQCGWLADRFGLSWQIVPANLGELMSAPGSYQKLMGMKKIQIDAFDVA